MDPAEHLGDLARSLAMIEPTSIEERREIARALGIELADPGTWPTTTPELPAQPLVRGISKSAPISRTPTVEQQIMPELRSWPMRVTYGLLAGGLVAAVAYGLALLAPAVLVVLGAVLLSATLANVAWRWLRRLFADRRDRRGVFDIEIAGLDDNALTSAGLIAPAHGVAGSATLRLTSPREHRFMLPPSRKAAMLRSLLTESIASDEIDIDRVVDNISSGELIDDLPFRQRKRWTSTAVVFVDRSPACAPFRRDFDAIVTIIKRTNGKAVAVPFIANPLRGWIDQFGDPSEIPDDVLDELLQPGHAVLVLSDLGSGRQRQLHPSEWIDFDERASERGSAVRYATPYPLVRLPKLLGKLPVLELDRLGSRNWRSAGSVRA